MQCHCGLVSEPPPSSTKWRELPWSSDRCGEDLSKMLHVLVRTGRTTVRRVLTKHPVASSCQINHQHTESSVITKPEQSVVRRDNDVDTEENRRIFKKRSIFDMCLEKFDDDLLYFPQTMTTEEWCSLVDHGLLVEEALKYVNYDKILKNGTVDVETREKLAKLNVFNMRIPQKYGGLEYKETQAQYIHEILGIRPSLARMVADNEEMGVKILVKYGTEAQKEKYLPKLAKGEMTLAFAFLEESSSALDPNSFLGLEVIQHDDKFTLKGEKCWVNNAKSADAFIVIGTQTIMDNEGLLTVTSLFLIDKDKENMIVYKPMEKKWFQGVEICTVVFDEVTVGTDCVLGPYGKGFEIFVDIFKNNRTSVLAECSSVMKRLVYDASDKCDHLKAYNKQLSFDYGDYGVGELSILAYATESLTYYLSGRADYYENPELDVEIALAKIFATEALPEAIKTYFSFIGRFSYDKNSVLEEFVQNAPYYPILDDSIFDLKIYIMSQAIKHLSIEKKTKFKELSQPFTYPLTKIKYVAFEMPDSEEDTATPKLDLRHCVDASVFRMADDLEYCIHRLAYGSEKHIVKHMKHSMEHDYDLLVLCEILANIYALIACIARASKSAQMKTKNYARDLELTYAFSTRTADKVRDLSSLVARNQEELESCAEIGRKAFTNKNYLAEHPLMRNF